MKYVFLVIIILTNTIILAQNTTHQLDVDALKVQIKSENNKHWIGALSYSIYTNTLDRMNQSPLKGDDPGELIQTS